MNALSGVAKADQNRALALSTIAFTINFAVWTIFAIIGVQIKTELGLNETQFGILVATPILTGSLTRLILGIWTEQYGGRIVFPAQMLLAALATWLLTAASTYPMFLVAALGVGLAGGSFAVGVAYVSHWYPREKQGTALGIFGAGNVGAAVTKFGAPFVMVAFGWEAVANVWALASGVYRRDLLPLRQERSGLRGAPQGRRARRRRSGAQLDAAQEHAGLALLALLLLRVRRLRGAGAVAAALPGRRLQRRYPHRRHGGGGLLAVGEHLPRLWRAPVGPVRRARGDVLDLRLLADHAVHAVLSADDLHDPRQGRRHHLLDPDGLRRLRPDDLRARLLHEPRQGGGLQAHPGLLSGQCRLGRRSGRDDRRPGRLRAADRLRRAARPHRHLHDLFRFPVPAGRRGADLDALGDPAHGARASGCGARRAAGTARIRGHAHPGRVTRPRR